MKTCLITFRSVTPAQRAEAALRRAGVDCTLQRTPRWMEEQGCGYSLRLPFSELTNCLSLLQTQQIPFRKIYLRRANGNLEELAL